ncbi:hypothetical protein [Pseudomonas sp.]|uniref:hypothetical protein n=1 Tax=Pseudomonas sp. TaxID=306 RepID=UPI003FD6EA8D
MSVVVNTKVWDKLKANFNKSQEKEIQLGWFPENKYGADKGNVQMAQVAHLNEEGHTNGSDSMFPGAYTPPRPFMRIGLKEALVSGSNTVQFDAMIKAVVSGQSVLKSLQQAVIPLEHTLRKVMEDWDTPGNAPATIALKGFDNPLHNSGELIANVTAKVMNREVVS